MPPRSPLRCLLVLALLYGVLIAPWPGVGEAYRAWFRGVGNAVFYRESGRWYVNFQDIPAAEQRGLDTRIELANRQQTDAMGRTPVRYLDIAMRGIAWVPLVLSVSLVVATPIPWSRRLRSLAAVIVAMHVFVLLSFWIHILNNADAESGPALVSLSPFLRTIVSALDCVFIEQYGAGFVMAVAVWVVATFRRGDLRLLFPAQSN
jgi:hypothetical protein